MNSIFSLQLGSRKRNPIVLTIKIVAALLLVCFSFIVGQRSTVHVQEIQDRAEFKAMNIDPGAVLKVSP